MDKEQALIEVWKTTVEVQKHFNELEMRIRSVAVTVLAAFLAAAGFTVKEKVHVWVFSQQVSLTAFVLIAGLICWLAFYGMDRFWYHRLLRGSVTQGLALENSIKSFVPEMQLTEAIGKASPVKVFRWNVHSGTKMDIFYGSVAVLIFIAALVSLFQPNEV